jgi:GTP-binding protein Era
VGQSAAKQRQQQQETQELQQGPQDTRRLTLAVVGLPNAGKSTLTNRLIGHKISGVSSKRNTTIEPQLGSFNVGNSQVRLIDSGGDATVAWGR